MIHIEMGSLGPLKKDLLVGFDRSLDLYGNIPYIRRQGLPLRPICI